MNTEYLWLSGAGCTYYIPLKDIQQASQSLAGNYYMIVSIRKRYSAHFISLTWPPEYLGYGGRGAVSRPPLEDIQ